MFGPFFSFRHFYIKSENDLRNNLRGNVLNIETNSVGVPRHLKDPEDMVLVSISVGTRNRCWDQGVCQRLQCWVWPLQQDWCQWWQCPPPMEVDEGSAQGKRNAWEVSFSFITPLCCQPQYSRKCFDEQTEAPGCRFILRVSIGYFRVTYNMQCDGPLKVCHCQRWEHKSYYQGHSLEIGRYK